MYKHVSEGNIAVILDMVLEAALVSEANTISNLVLDEVLTIERNSSSTVRDTRCNSCQ